MCSILGIADLATKSNNCDADIILPMGETLTHRGPDQKGVYCGLQFSFQHNRLAIIDVENGIQPMKTTYEGFDYIIIYNGEIYNAQELTKELKELGFEFTTHCDTEVVLKAYICWGKACSDKLNGIFAFAVFDGKYNQIYLSRDRFGVKPLFYTMLGSKIIFASEIKAILKHPDIKARMDKENIWQLLFLSPARIIGTGVFKDICEIPNACHAIYNAEGLKIEKYWNLEAYEFTGSSEEAISNTGELLRDAINRQLVSDVPLCTFLSGGLDSSAITAVAAEVYKNRGERLSTYSFEYEGNKEHFKNSLFQPQSDDEYAMYLADYLDTKHTVLTAKTTDIVNYLKDALDFRDMPGMADLDSSLLFYCRQVKENHKVALSGECADEVFGGYPWFYREEMLNRPCFPWIHDPFVRINLFNEDFANPNQGYEYICDIYNQSKNSCPMLSSDSSSMKQSRLATWLSVNYFMTSLLERKDRMSMASGLEVRVPFADHRLVEYVYNVPWEIKYRSGVEKSLLREAMRDFLPDKILHRKKSPYPKSHNPEYEKIVLRILNERLLNPNSILRNILKKDAINSIINSENNTWYGQLMGRPQLIAWLIQMDHWFEKYNISIV